MIIKRGASIQGLHLSMRAVLIAADRVWKKLGIKEGVTITSGTEDYVHSAGSLHPYGYALDFRTRYFDDQGEEAARRLRIDLPADYDVVLEGNHIHVENDRLFKLKEKLCLE